MQPAISRSEGPLATTGERGDPPWLDRTRDYPFTSRFVDVEGSRVHHVDEGRGPTRFLLANPLWSFYFRNVILLHGQDAVARFSLASTRYLPDRATPEIAEVNGAPAAILRVGGAPLLVIAIEGRDDRVAEIRVLGNPAKLRALTWRGAGRGSRPAAPRAAPRSTRSSRGGAARAG